MPDARFPVEVVRGVPVVAAPEEIDITNAEALRSALLTAAADGYRTLVVDMTRTRFCDSSGLHALIAAHKRAGAEGREVLLVIPSTAVLRVFALTGMDTVIPNFTSLAEALAQAPAAANGRSRQRDKGDARAGGGPRDVHQGARQCRAGIRGRGPGASRRVRRAQADVRETRRPLDPETGPFAWGLAPPVRSKAEGAGSETHEDASTP
jgi:anti-sigma B factor antagonist